jgi:enoyl-CoA hydratase
MEMVRELTAVCDHLEDQSECKVVVLQGSDGRFCEGIDFAEFKPDQAMDIHGFNKWEKISARIERLPKAIIAVLDGPARGGGAQLALVADAVVASPNATIQFDEVHQGFLPGMATFRLAKIVGLGHAKRLIMQSPVVTANEAKQLGIVSSVSADLESALAETIHAFGPIHNVAVTLARRLLNESFSTEFENAIGNFLAAQHRAIHQTPFLETIKKHQDE